MRAALRDIAMRRDPRQPGPVIQRLDARGPVNGALVGAALWILLLVGVATLHGQVQPVVQPQNGSATTLVRNASREALRVTVELRFGTLVGRTVELGREVRALVSPATFALEPGATQTLRIKLKEAVPSGATLRLCTLFTPTYADAPDPAGETTAVARLVMRTRLITKVMMP